jgi:hypothetical protein
VRALIDGDVHFHVISWRQGPGVSEIEGIAVDVCLAIPPVKDEGDTRVLVRDCIDAFDMGSDVFEGKLLSQREIEVF